MRIVWPFYFNDIKSIRFKLGSKHYRLIIFLLALVYFALVPFYEPTMSFYLLDPNWIFNFKVIFTMLYRFLLSICGCCLIYSLFYFLIKNSLIKKLFCLTLKCIGIRTLAIYILSMWIQEGLYLIYSKFYVVTSNYFVIIGISFAFFCVLLTCCILLEIVLSKNGRLHKLLFG